VVSRQSAPEKSRAAPTPIKKEVSTAVKVSFEEWLDRLDKYLESREVSA